MEAGRKAGRQAGRQAGRKAGRDRDRDKDRDRNRRFGMRRLTNPEGYSTVPPLCSVEQLQPWYSTVLWYRYRQLDPHVVPNTSRVVCSHCNPEHDYSHTESDRHAIGGHCHAEHDNSHTESDRHAIGGCAVRAVQSRHRSSRC